MNREERNLFYQRVALAMKAYRSQTKITQEALGKRLGVAQTVVARWEKGETSMHAHYFYEFQRISGFKI